MKKLVILFCLLMLGSLNAPGQVNAEISFGSFYSSLSAYGEWIPVDGDVYAWKPPEVAGGWRPYMNGQWVWTDEGWYWASDEPWSWATYHYGRWYYDSYYGWLWIPGYEWAPAWVEWRYGGDYVGWAPLGPYAVFSTNFGVHYRSPWVTPYDYWSFVDCRYMTSPHLHRYVYRTNENVRIIGRTRTAGNVRSEGGRVVSRGVDPSYIERRGNVRIERAELADIADHQRQGIVRSGDRERVDVYRPRVEERLHGVEADRPQRVREAERTPSIDTRHIDVRSREQASEAGRDIKRAQEYRSQRLVVPDQGVDRNMRTVPPRGPQRDPVNVPRPSHPEVGRQTRERSTQIAPGRIEPQRRPVPQPSQIPRNESPRVRAAQPQRAPASAPPRESGGERSRGGERRGR